MDAFEARREKLRGLSDEQLHARFWELTRQVVAPLVELARTHTSPSIERSVLLRCGLSSAEAAQVVNRAAERRLLGFGAGNLVLMLSRKRNLPFAQAARHLVAGEYWEEISP